jgi:hypothetical protein
MPANQNDRNDRSCRGENVCAAQELRCEGFADFIGVLACGYFASRVLERVVHLSVLRETSTIPRLASTLTQSPLRITSSGF